VIKECSKEEGIDKFKREFRLQLMETKVFKTMIRPIEQINKEEIS